MKKLQKGGHTNQWVDSVLNANQALNFVQRYLYPNKYPVIKNPDGSHSTHLMASADNLSFPTIIQESNGKLVQLPIDSAYNYAIKNKQFIEFPSENDAAWFSENGYKKGKQYKQKGGPSVEGYKSSSPDRFNDYNIINSSYITMYGVPHPVLGIDNLGNKQMMVPGKDYKFPGKSVIEFPMKKYKKGGSKVDRMSSLSDEEAMYYYLNNIPLPTELVKTMPQLSPIAHPFVGGMPSFIPQTVSNPTPKKKKEISFEPLYDKKGNITAYSPVFSGYTRHDAIKDASQVLPSHISNVPVEFSKETYGDLWNNFMPGTTSEDWTPTTDPTYKPYTVKQHRDPEDYTFKDGGQMNPIYVSDKNDPRLRAYEDSLRVYKKYETKADSRSKVPLITKDIFNRNNIASYTNDWKYTVNDKDLEKRVKDREYKDVNFRPISFGAMDGEGLRYPRFKKPVQTVIYKNPSPKENPIEKLSPINKILDSNIDSPKLDYIHGNFHVLMPYSEGNLSYPGGHTESGYRMQKQEYKDGGWIPKDLKKGRCTPAPNPDCPVGSPQYNLAMTFKKHHGFHQMGGGVDNTGHAPISVPVNSRYPYGDPRAYGLPASPIMEQYNPKTREGQVVNPAFNKWADNVFWPSMDAMGLAELPVGALKSLPKRVAKSMVGVDDLGMYTKVGDKQLYELGNGFGEQRALNEVKKAHQLQKKPVVPKSLKNLPEETDYNYVHTEGQRLYPNQRYSIDPRDYPEPGGMTEAKKDAYDVVGKWLMENRMGKSDRIGSLLQSIQYNQMGGQTSGPSTGSYTQYSLPYGNWNTQKQWDFGVKPDPNKNKRGNQDTWKNDFEDSSAIDPEQDKKDALNAWAQREYNARMNAANVMGTVGSSIQGMIDGADLASQFMNKIQNQRSLDKQTHFMGYSDNQFYTGAGTSRGDYFNGMFRPDQMGNFSFAGMNNGIYYPKRAKLGLQIGEDIPNFAVPAFTSGMMPVMKSDSIPAPNTKVSVSKEAQKAYDYYLGKGLKPHIAAGIVGNLVQESDMNPSNTNSMGAFGVGQWLGERKTNFFNWARQNNMDPYKLETQLQYVLVEPKESKKVLAAMEKTKSPSEAAYVFANVYERMGKIEANYPRRLGVAEKLYNKTFQVGGEVEMTEEEILQFKAMGGEIEIID